jgi:hypothetical protein
MAHSATQYSLSQAVLYFQNIMCFHSARLSALSLAAIRNNDLPGADFQERSYYVQLSYSEFHPHRKENHLGP